MAISYSLELATPLPPAQVAERLAAAIGTSEPDLAARLSGEDGALTPLGTWIRVVARNPQPWHPVVADLGITPTVSVAFRLDKDNNIPAQQDDVARIVVRLLDLMPGDAVLHRELEDIWLLRRGGQLTRSANPEIWPPQRLRAFGGRNIPTAAMEFPDS